LTSELRTASETPDLDARLILAHALGRDRVWLVTHPEERIGPAVLAALAALGERRRKGEPLAYVLGEAWFFGRAFEVSPDVLVPRPETEHLVEAALAELQSRRRREGERLRVCDVGTGSGAIALTLAAEMPFLDVVASDTSAAALAIARRNAQRLERGQNVTFVRGDLGGPLLTLGPFDCVVANLPYVPTAQVPQVPDPVGFEPRVAVDGGADGLVLYRRLIRQLPALAAPGAAAFLEAAPGTIQALAGVVERELPGAHVEIGEDYSGLERWVAVALA